MPTARVILKHEIDLDGRTLPVGTTIRFGIWESYEDEGVWHPGRVHFKLDDRDDPSDFELSLSEFSRVTWLTERELMNFYREEEYYIREQIWEEYLSGTFDATLEQQVALLESHAEWPAAIKEQH